MNELEGKVALVTGGSNGIGFASAKHFVAKGVHPFIAGHRQTELDGAFEEIDKNVTGIQNDVSNLADFARLFVIIGPEERRSNILVADAGVGGHAPLGSIVEKHFDKTFNTNVKSLLFRVQRALPLSLEGDSIVLKASITRSKASRRGFQRLQRHRSRCAIVCLQLDTRSWILKNARFESVRLAPVSCPLLLTIVWD